MDELAKAIPKCRKKMDEIANLWMNVYKYA
jgi:hypothetical protein